MDRQVGEVSEGLVLDLSVQSKQAAKVIAGIRETLDGVGDFSNVDCSWFAHHSPNIPGRVGDSQRQAEKILATNCSRNRSEVLFYQKLTSKMGWKLRSRTADLGRRWPVEMMLVSVG